MTGSVGMDAAKFRYYRRTAWQVLRARYAAAVADAIDDGAPETGARQGAARAVRGELRMLMSDLLTHAPVPAIVDFLAAARDWGENGERLLEQGDVIVALVETVEPQASWRGPAVLGREAAGDDVQWAAWVQAWIGAFRATGPTAAAVVPDQPPPGEAPQAGQKSKQSRWVPWALSAAAVVGTTVVVVLNSRE
jgi:hypothetical protein